MSNFDDIEWEPIEGGRHTYIKISGLKAGDEFTGVYKHSDRDMTYNKLQHYFDVNGSSFVYNGAGQLDKFMEKVPQGALVKIIYKGSEVIGKGPYKGKPAHQFQVFHKLVKGPVVITDNLQTMKDGTTVRPVVAAAAPSDFEEIPFGMPAKATSATDKQKRIEEARRSMK